MADDRRSLIAPKLPIRGGLSLRRSDERLRADLPVLCLRRRPPTERNPAPNDTSFARELGDPPEPYEVLLHAAMVGDHQYFAREDSVEETWRIVQPLLDHPPDVRPYPRGSWGPEEAETLLRGHPRWQQPWLPEEG
jgi:glucose-6-phosphate 1-dehydrogenase